MAEYMNNVLIHTLLALLLLAVNANYTIQISCSPCFSGFCLNVTGGVFNSW